jgi:hypothetical protein
MPLDTLSSDDLRSLPARTLRAAGYEIVDFQQTKDVVEIRCRIPSRFGAELAFLFVFTSRQTLLQAEYDDFAFAAKSQGLTFVCIAQQTSRNQISWAEFTRAVGGQSQVGEPLRRRIGRR